MQTADPAQRPVTPYDLATSMTGVALTKSFNKEEEARQEPYHIRLGHGDFASAPEARRRSPGDALIILIVAAHRRFMTATVLLRCQLQHTGKA